MRKWPTLLIIIMGIAGLTAGCQKPAENADAHKIKYALSKDEKAERASATSSTSENSDAAASSDGEDTTSASTSSSAASSSQKTEAVVWTPAKAQALHDFVMTWEKSMGQQYQEYGPTNDVKFYGMPIDADAIQKNKIAVNDQPVTVSWSKDGTGAAQYKIVAMYSDAATARYAAQHLYLFALDATGQPVVLITMQNQGMPDGRLHFKPTANSALAAGFARIVAD